MDLQIFSRSYKFSIIIKVYILSHAPKIEDGEKHWERDMSQVMFIVMEPIPLNKSYWSSRLHRQIERERERKHKNIP